MKIDVKNNAEEIVKEMFWLAWQACGDPMGMGAFQDQRDASKGDVWRNVQSAGDYASNRNYKRGKPYGDYVFGRMMKLGVNYGEGYVELRASEPRADYQSWCREYPTYEALFNAAKENVEGVKA